MLSLLLVLNLGAPMNQTLSIQGAHYRLTHVDTGSGQSQYRIADLDQDGSAELVVAGGDTLRRYAFRGGTMVLIGQIDVGPNAHEFAIGAIDDDAYADIAVANHETAFLTLLQGGPDHLHTPRRIDVPVDPHPHVVRLADFNHDGINDLIVDDRNAKGVRLLQGTDEWSFVDMGIAESSGDPYRGFALGDLNDDGWIDLVTPDPDRVSVLINESGRFSRGQDVTATGPFAVELADVNGDGDLDLIVADNGASSEVLIRFGDGAGQFPLSYKPIPMARGGKAIVVGDVNGDSIADALVTCWEGEAVLILGGSTGLEIVHLPVTGNPWGSAIGDLNGDGNADIVLGDGVESATTVWISDRRTVSRSTPLRPL